MNLTETEKESLSLHRCLRGKIGTHNKMPVHTKEDLSLAYTPGVAAPCMAIAKDESLTSQLTLKGNAVAVVSDGSAVLGLGNIGASASIPVMEGKALLFKEYANIDAWPLCLDTQDSEEIIKTVRQIAPVFGGINLEDISAPRCFEIEEKLQDLGIPVFHDDQHGTAIVLLAALINASRVTGREFSSLSVVINGAGAAGTAIAKLLRCMGQDQEVCSSVQDVIVCDSKGAIHNGRDDLNETKKTIASFTNKNGTAGSLKEIISGCDVFVGVSKGNVLTQEDVRAMAPDPIILAMANPEPEIMPDLAKAAGAAIVGTGRSDFPNQVNNVLAFPGIFRGALDVGATRITEEMKIAAAFALADSVKNPSADLILPSPLDRTVAPLVAQAVADAFSESKE
jgi:malate dehydrogenase (oxaloacetate-decarboxylating)